MKYALLLLAACNAGHSDASDRAARAKGIFVEHVIDTPAGMSGLAVDDKDILWAVPERDRRFVRLTLDGAVTLYPMVGFPEGEDTEGLAWLGANKFAVSTEGQEVPTASLIYAELVDGKLVATKTRNLTSEELGVTLTNNHGAEGACGFGDDVLVAIEAVGKLPDGNRYAPIARLRGDALSITKVALTSDVGKLSALDCTIDPDGTAHVWAIERHFGVSRILRFEVPLGAILVTPRITLDLGQILQNSLNLEGIIQLKDGRLVVINDNQGHTIEGPSELLIFEPGAGTR